MFLPLMSNVEATVSTLVAAGGVYSGIRTFLASSRRKKAAYRQSILNEAEASAELMKKELEYKIKAAMDEIENIRTSIENELSNLKNNHSLELKALGEKVQLLREELQDQSRGILTLLTKLIDK